MNYRTVIIILLLAYLLHSLSRKNRLEGYTSNLNSVGDLYLLDEVDYNEALHVTDIYRNNYKRTVDIESIDDMIDEVGSNNNNTDDTIDSNICDSNIKDNVNISSNDKLKLDGLYTITTQADGIEKCLVFPALSSYPEKYIWDMDTFGRVSYMQNYYDVEDRNRLVSERCGFPTQEDLIVNGKGVWRFNHIKDDLYTITHREEGGMESCLGFSSNGDDRYPMKVIFNQAQDPNIIRATCGKNCREELLEDGRAVFRVNLIPGTKDLYTITNKSGKTQSTKSWDSKNQQGTFVEKEERCVAFGGNGHHSFYPERLTFEKHGWGNPELIATNSNTIHQTCGYPSVEDMVEDKKAVWRLTKVG